MPVTAFTEEKQKELAYGMEVLGLDLLLLMHTESSPNVNVQYMTGYPTWGILLVSRTGERILGASDIPVAKQMGTADEIKPMAEWYKGKNPEIVEDIKRLGGSHPVIGVTENFKISEYRYVSKLLEDHLPNGLISLNPAGVDHLLNQIRSRKSPAELEALEKAIKIADSMQGRIHDFLISNLDATELDLALMVEQNMRKQGAEALAFETLVANGNRSWQIHTIPAASSAPLHKGSLGLIDYGCKYQGYCSDITIPFGLRSLTDKEAHIRRLVEKTAKLAIDNIKIGTRFEELAELADKILRDAGYPMPHSLGHGLGLTVHDAPYIRRKRNSISQKPSQTIEPGMVFTIEPGIYVEGVGGVRLENDIIVYEDGPICASSSRFIETG
ncbi:MAG: M24 family metallopeptidase [Candidatus Ranarchaeia archaeon]